MKPGLSLRVSQHLALTPQLQQSIRFAAVVHAGLGQEVEQMLDETFSRTPPTKRRAGSLAWSMPTPLPRPTSTAPMMLSIPGA